MNYSDFFRYSITGDNSLFKLAIEGKSQKYTMLNIFMLGLFFGLSELVGSLSLGDPVPLDGKFAFISPVIFTASGVVNMMIAIIGLSLVYWSASKAFGGYAGLTQSFQLVSLSLAPFWVLAPLLNYIIRFHPDTFFQIHMLVPVLLSSFWAYRVLCNSMIAGQEIPPFKANLAVMGMVIFSLSSIYVMIP